MKKWKWALIAGIALALIAAFCLWYTRPQKLAAILGGWEPDSLSASASDPTPILTGDGQVASIVDVWLLNGVTVDDPALEEIWAALEGHIYRAPLASIPHNLFAPGKGYTIRDSRGTVSLSFGRENSTWVSIAAYGDDAGTVYITGPKGTGSCRYQAGAGLYEELARIVRKYGTSQK